MIKATSGVTLKVMAQARNAGIVLVGIVIYEEHMSASQIRAYAMSLVAFGFYNYYKMSKPAGAVQLSELADEEDRIFLLPRAARAVHKRRERGHSI